MSSFRLVAALALLAITARSAAAQCTPTGDGLDGGPACTGAFTQVPQGKFVQPSLGICWSSCNVSAVAPYRAHWGTLTPMSINPAIPPSCAWYTSALVLYQAGIPRWQGTMNLMYSRTWTESSATTKYQVWRYLVNGDLRYVHPTPGPCAIPPCAAPNGNRVRYTGYIDYALSCPPPPILPTLESAWMITHACDTIDHAPGFPRAGVFHPNQYYSFVGPSAGFVPAAPSPTESGATALECVRKWDATALPARCDHEEPLLFANFNSLGTLCLCGTGAGPWYEAFLNAGGNAGTTIGPYPGSDPFRSVPIGAWTNPNAYPGLERVRWNSNDTQWIECTGVGRREYHFGVTTIGGFPAMSLPTPVGTVPVPLPPTFIDQSNSMLLPANVPTRNTPYRSDHIINLNL